jgi:hypothetical protein
LTAPDIFSFTPDLSENQIMLKTTELPATTMKEDKPQAASRGLLLNVLSANLASSAAAVMVNITAAAHVKQVTGSAVWAAVAIVVAYLPPLFIGSYLGGLIDRKLRRSGILVAEIVSAVATVGCGAAIAVDAPLAVVLALLGFLLSIRSLAVAAVRNSLTRWMKLDAPEAVQEGRMQMFIFTILLALPTSGLAMGWAASVNCPLAVSITAAALAFHVAALGVMTRLPARPPEAPKVVDPPNNGRQEGLLDTVRSILADRKLGLLFVACLFAQPVFQAAEQVLVSVKGNSLGTAAMAQMQTAGGVGLLIGFGLLQLVRARGVGVWTTAFVVAVGLASLVLTASFETEGSVLSAFLGMTLVYEFLDSYYFGRFFKQAPPAHVARFSITATNLGGTLMGISAVGFGLTIDALGFGRGAAVFVVSAVAYGLILLWVANRFRRA